MAKIVSPCDAVIQWYHHLPELPKQVKNEHFTIKECGIPNWERYQAGPAAMLYLSPADYHCFHAPVDGKITHCSLLDQDKYSLCVYFSVFENVNISKRL